MDRPVDAARPAAEWSSRFGAWLIDLLLVGGFVAIMGDLLGLGTGLPALANPLDVGQHSVLLFVYWTLFETSTGQSPGKLALGLQVVGRDDRPPSFVKSGTQSFGKAFLLPLDVVVGLLVMRGQRLRLFNRLSGTRVVAVAGPGPRQRGPSAVEA